ncbi:MAG: hypothetical protein ABMA64_15180 [Myxococcota bacterium]
MLRWLVPVLFVGHGAVTVMALRESGFLGIFTQAFSSWTHLQVFSDLAVSLVLLSAYIVADARRSGTSPWPFLAAVPLLGSFGPLAWWAWRTARQPTSAT